MSQRWRLVVATGPVTFALGMTGRFLAAAWATAALWVMDDPLKSNA